MITTKLQGGTGNQMFQFAMGLAQARRLKSGLRLDIGGFHHDQMREYTLSLFPRINRFARANISEVPVTVHESGMPYNQSLVDSIEIGDSLKGYWQTEKYFEKIVYEVIWYFEPSPLTPDQREWCHAIMNSENPTFLTIRRTDYVGNTFHGELSIDYYKEALKIITDKTGTPDIFVFTDDIIWCQNYLVLPHSFQIAGTYDRTVKGHIGREDADLYLMSKCKNAVMANSSFSWWGAYLGADKNGGTIVAPKQWFGPTSNEDARDIVPDRWTTI